jgi:thiamine pyrophosphate-dependent acetolactate synthase large subunit-like protein
MSVTQSVTQSGQTSGGRLVFLNALPLNAFKLSKLITLFVHVIDVNELKGVVEGAKALKIPVVNYIRHEGTVKYLNKKLSLDLTPSSGLYEFQKYDVLVVITLKKPERGKEVSEISDNDIEIYLIEVYC